MSYCTYLVHTSTTSSILLNTQQSYGRHQIKICKLGYLRMHSVAVVVVVGCRRSNSFGFSTPNTPSPRVPRNFLESRLLQAILLFTARAWVVGVISGRRSMANSQCGIYRSTWYTTDLPHFYGQYRHTYIHTYIRNQLSGDWIRDKKPINPISK